MCLVFSGWLENAATNKYYPMEIQPVVGIYDLGHNLAEWVTGTPIQVSLETDMTGTSDCRGDPIRRMLV